MMNEMDTHSVFKKLVKRGFTDQQAEGITEAISSSTPSDQKFVRKELFEDSEKDRYESKANFAVMKSELTYVKDNMVTKPELEAKIEILKSELNYVKDTMVTKSELKSELKDLHNDILKWMIPFLVTIMIGLFVPLFLKF